MRPSLARPDRSGAKAGINRFPILVGPAAKISAVWRPRNTAFGSTIFEIVDVPP